MFWLSTESVGRSQLICHLCKRKFVLASACLLLLLLVALFVSLNVDVKVKLSLYRPGHALRALGVLGPQNF
jgi:hypothetical protein